MSPRATHPTNLPVGWDEARICRLLDYYENQSDDDAVQEDEDAADHRRVAAGEPDPSDPTGA
jgi:hypothetical protein